MKGSILTLRHVFGKQVPYVIVMPCKDPDTGDYPPHVKRVNSSGDMILTDAERNENGKTKFFIPIDAQIMIYDGKTFDLDRPREAAEWYAIQFCRLIAKSRNERDSRGNLIIDGSDYTKNGEGRYGVAEFYIEDVEAEVTNANNKKVKRHEAETFVINDSPAHRRTIARLLGRNMNSSIDADVIAYLLETAEEMPDKIIDTYTGPDNRYRLLLIEALDKGVIVNKSGLYMWGESTILGGNEDSVITWMKNPENLRLFEVIKTNINPLYSEKRNSDPETTDVPKEDIANQESNTSKRGGRGSNKNSISDIA